MALIIDFKVIPSSGRSGFKIDKAGRLVCYLKSAAQRGQANTELIKLLAKALRIPIRQFSFVSGQASRNKRIKIDAHITQEQLLVALGLDQQINLFADRS